MITLAVIGDTHLPGRGRDLPPSCWRYIEASDAVLHTGDVTSGALLGQLAAVKHLHVVRGNNDRDLSGVPETLSLDVGGVHIAMVHDSGPSTGRRRRLRALFPEARVVVYGHSHIPFLEDDGELLLLNPGSPTDRRRMPTFTMALLRIDGGAPTAEIVDLGLDRS